MPWIRFPRRRLLQLGAGAGAFFAVARWARAQAYPSRPVRVIVGFSAGGPTDTLARLMGQWLTERLGQSFLVENRPGAGSNLATEAVVRAAPDGQTLLLITGANAVNATLYNRLNFNFLQDIVSVAALCREPMAMLVNPAVPASTIAEFIAYTKANPGKVTMASGGIGAPSHMAGEMFKMLTGTDMVHVPYRGAVPALTDLLAGQVQIYFTPLISALDHIKAGKLRVLGVTTLERSKLLPDTPSIKEFVPGYDASQLYGVGAPKSTPGDIVDTLNKEINAGLADPKVSERLAQIGVIPLPGSPTSFSKLFAEETEKWAKVIEFSGATAD
jgi:tripartite-type tricarboxylate transporter receptor subunit TctC